MELNETARTALKANLDFYWSELGELIRRKENKETALEELKKEITKVEGYVRDLEEALNVEREYSEGVE